MRFLSPDPKPSLEMRQYSFAPQRIPNSIHMTTINTITRKISPQRKPLCSRRRVPQFSNMLCLLLGKCLLPRLPFYLDSSCLTLAWCL